MIIISCALILQLLYMFAKHHQVTQAFCKMQKALAELTMDLKGRSRIFVQWGQTNNKYKK